MLFLSLPNACIRALLVSCKILYSVPYHAMSKLNRLWWLMLSLCVDPFTCSNLTLKILSVFDGHLQNFCGIFAQGHFKLVKAVWLFLLSLLTIWLISLIIHNNDQLIGTQSYCWLLVYILLCIVTKVFNWSSAVNTSVSSSIIWHQKIYLI